MPESLATVLQELGLARLLAVLAVAVVAAVMRAFTGFGFALTAVPAFSLMMPPTQAVVLSAALAFFAGVIALPTYWDKVSVGAIGPMLGAALVGTAVGAALLSGISPAQFQFWIGLSVIAACAALSFYRPVRYRQPGLGLQGFTGLLSGLMNGALAIPGPPVIIYAMATQPPERSRAMLMAFFTLSGLLALGAYAVAGFVTPATPWLVLLAFPAMYLGDKLGYLLFRRYGGALYRRVAILVLLALGGVILARSFTG